MGFSARLRITATSLEIQLKLKNRHGVQRTLTDQNGIERYTTEIHADQLQMLDSAPQANGY